MIQVHAHLHCGNITEIEVMGHAGFDEIGKDLVCAGVSCIMYGTLNALDSLLQTGFKVKLSEKGYIQIQVQETSEILQIILRTTMIQLETMVESYSQYIKIKKTEVWL